MIFSIGWDIMFSGDKIYILENEMEDMSKDRDDLRKDVEEKEKAVASLQRKVS